METITKEYKVYEFNELSKEVQEQLIKEEKEAQNLFYCENFLQEDMNSSASCLLEKYFKGAELNDVYYDLDYSQGSGSMIAFTINIKDLNNKYNLLSKEELRYIQDKGIINDIEIYHNDNIYYNEYSFGIRYNDNYGYYDYEDIKEDYDISKEDFQVLEIRIINFLDSYCKLNSTSQFIKDIIDMNCELTKDGYTYSEYEISDYEAIDWLQEFKYLEDGTRFN